MHILAGDIGGTNTRLMFSDEKTGSRQIIAEKSYPSADYAALIDVIKIFLTEHQIDIAPDAACFAVAGPIKSGIVIVTNLPWIINERELCEFLNTSSVSLINDFIAVSYGIADLDKTDLLILQQGTNSSSDNTHSDAAVIGAGTGLGASHLVWQNDHYIAYSSEAGHTGFSPENEQQCQLLAWLQKSHAHVSLELLLSGRGLKTIYRFLHEVSGLTESSDIFEEMRNTDPAQIISQHALLDNDELCQKTLECFVDIYGVAASNVALSYYPVDTVYIAGGIAVKIKDKIMSQRFIDAFTNKGLMSSNMKALDIRLINNEKVGLYGALIVARRLVS